MHLVACGVLDMDWHVYRYVQYIPVDLDGGTVNIMAMLHPELVLILYILQLQPLHRSNATAAFTRL